MHWTLLFAFVLVPSASAVAIYQQCGGEGYRGATQCDWPLQCFRRSRWFSSCQTSCPGGDWECGSLGHGSGGASGAGAKPWDQCGGEGWRGATWCIQYPCQARSEWYSQCRPDCPTGWRCSGAPTPVASTAGPTGPASSTAGPTGPASSTAGPTGPASSTAFVTVPPSVPSEGSSPWFPSSTTLSFSEGSSSAAPFQTSTSGNEEEEDLSGLEPYDPAEFDDEELETDGFPDPSEYNLDELQQQEQGLLEETRRRRRRRNTVRATACTAENARGSCIATSSCSGKSVAGKCPGDANIQCCIPKGTSCSADGQNGICIATSSCAGRSVAGKCPGAADIQCCVADGSTDVGEGSSEGLCGSYVGAAVSSIAGNGNVIYSVVKIKQAHLSTPSSYSLSATQSDNTMTTTTACAFDKMASAAKSAGVTITIASGFRTIARQEYFWNCYQTKACNGGNLAARPGTSNHGKGIALDLNTNCGSQTGAKPNCGGSQVYQWLYNNAHKYGFTRTVQSEPWHWEFRGVGVAPASFS